MAASGSSQIAYQGKSQAVESNSASVVHPAATSQLAPTPRAPGPDGWVRRGAPVRHNASASTARKPATNR